MVRQQQQELQGKSKTSFLSNLFQEIAPTSKNSLPTFGIPDKVLDLLNLSERYQVKLWRPARIRMGIPCLEETLAQQIHLAPSIPLNWVQARVARRITLMAGQMQRWNFDYLWKRVTPRTDCFLPSMCLALTRTSFDDHHRIAAMKITAVLRMA